MAGAVAGYAEVLSDMVRVLGPDHPDTLTARISLLAGEAGDVVVRWRVVACRGGCGAGPPRPWRLDHLALARRGREWRAQ